MSKGLVLITGITGFVGTEVGLTFLRAGYRVRATGRSTAQLDRWINAFPEFKDSFESVVVPDMAVDGAFDEAVKGVDYVIHTASPFHFEIKDNETDMLIPALKGTTAILSAVEKEPKIKHLVVTSSFAAIGDILAIAMGQATNTTYTDDDWNPATWETAKGSDNAAYVYCASKKIAEEACWEFQKKEKPSFDITAINPPMIFGPPEQELKSLDSLNTSAGAVWGVVDAKEVPPVGFPVWVDVRDVSKLHLLAVTKDVARNQRYLCTAGYYTNDAIVDILKRNFPDQAHRLPAHNPDNLDTSGKAHFSTDSSKVRKDLGIEFISLEKSVVDTAAKLFDTEKKLKA